MLSLPLYISPAIIHYILMYMVRESMDFNLPLTQNSHPLSSCGNTQYQAIVVTNNLGLYVG